ncbi:MAG: helix-turn-helix domain-containing protein [Erysipelotrichaceae bacterium]|nr:helix-turn-helix domain-containing protein [Erysipelotrichaceae bacterium]
MNNLGEEIKQKRLEKGLSVEELSKKTMLSVAVINDIENGAFDRYKGDETYVRMYLKKISNALDLDDEQIAESYRAVTEELEREALRLAEEKKDKAKTKMKNRKEFHFDNPHMATSTTQIYEDKSHVKVVRGVIVALICVLIIGVVYIGVWYTKSKPSAANDFSSQTATVQGDVDTSTNKTDTSVADTGNEKTETNENTEKPDDTEKPENTQTETKKQENKKTKPATTPSVKVKFKRTGDNAYTVTVPSNLETINFKVKFSKKSWAQLYVNDKSYGKFTPKIYSKETVTVKLKTAKTKTIRMRNGSQLGTKYYINDNKVPLTSEEQNMTSTNLTLKIKVKK